MRSVTLARLLPILLLGAAAAAPAQVLTVEPDQWDFGTMKQQETRTTNIVIRNDGGGLLVIEEVNADCGCTVPSLLTKELQPGESTEMEIEFSSKRFTGNVFKTVRIHSNDPTNPVQDIVVTAHVTTPLTVDPVSRRIGFARSAQGDTFTQRVTFTASEAEELEITVDGTRKNLFDVAVTNGLDGDPRRAAVDVTLPVDMPVGKQRDAVRVRTNLPEVESVDIEVRCWVYDLLMVSPETVNFRFKSTFRQTLRVAPAGESLDFKITGAEIDLPELEIEIVETVANEETLVVLTGTPVDKDDPRARKSQGRIKGTLVIHTDLATQARIEVPITYMVRM